MHMIMYILERKTKMFNLQALVPEVYLSHVDQKSFSSRDINYRIIFLEHILFQII